MNHANLGAMMEYYILMVGKKVKINVFLNLEKKKLKKRKFKMDGNMHFLA